MVQNASVLLRGKQYSVQLRCNRRTFFDDILYHGHDLLRIYLKIMRIWIADPFRRAVFSGIYHLAVGKIIYGSLDEGTPDINSNVVYRSSPHI